MTEKHAAPAPFTDEPTPDIPLTPVKSNQVAAIGYRCRSVGAQECAKLIRATPESKEIGNA
jgi:hypothetical protein